MAEHGYRWEPDAGLLVVEDGRVVGVVTARSLLQGVKGKEPGEATAL